RAGQLPLPPLDPGGAAAAARPDRRRPRGLRARARARPLGRRAPLPRAAAGGAGIVSHSPELRPVGRVESTLTDPADAGPPARGGGRDADRGRQAGDLSGRGAGALSPSAEPACAPPAPPAARSGQAPAAGGSS